MIYYQKGRPMALPSMIKKLSLGILVSSTILGANHMAQAATSTVPLVQKWDKTFAKSDSVTHQKVTFKTVMASRLPQIFIYQKLITAKN